MNQKNLHRKTLKIVLEFQILLQLLGDFVPQADTLPGICTRP